MIFDNKHRFSNLQNSIFLKLIKINDVEYHISKISSFFIKKVNLFKIVKKINDFAYKLEFSTSIKIYNIISIIHLKQITTNFYEKQIFLSISIIDVENDEFWMIEKIVQQKKRDRFQSFVIKWKNYEKSIWKSIKRLIKNVSNLIKRFEFQRIKNWIRK